MPSSDKNRFDGLMFYSLITAVMNYPVRKIMRMKVDKTQ